MIDLAQKVRASYAINQDRMDQPASVKPTKE